MWEIQMNPTYVRDAQMIKTLKPIYDHDSYSAPVEKALYSFFYAEIFAPLLDILQPPGRKLNSLAKGKPDLYVHDIPVYIENPRGSIRKGKDWEQLMVNDYGYICDTQAVDGDELDCFLGNDLKSVKVFIIEQVNPRTLLFDEYKVMLGFSSPEEAKNAYHKNYQSDWQGFKSIIERDIFNFSDWYVANVFGLGQKMNAVESVLVKALKTGRLRYTNDTFYGKLDASLSKALRGIGATYNKTKKSYTIKSVILPLEIKVAIAEGNRKEAEKVSAVENKLTEMEGKSLTPLNIDVLFGDTLKKLDTQFHSSTKTLTRNDIALPIDQSLVPELKEAYTKNLDKYIKDWHETQVLRLRKKVHENVEAGFRAENLIQVIQQEKNVSKNKAKFLARQETSLMVSKYRQIRYEEVGIDNYIWSTSHDSRVRHDHKELQGKVFSFSNPPVTDKNTGARNNPGEDFGCRCVAIPVMPEREVLRKELAHVGK